MDIGLWDDVRQSQDHSLTAADREAFYQLLSAVGQTHHSPLTTRHSLDVVPLLEQPAEHFGEVLPVQKASPAG